MTPSAALGDELWARAAHEARTPLTSLLIAIQLCLEGRAGPVTDRQVDLLHAAQADCQRLQRAIDDLLALARLTAPPTP